MEFQQLFVTEVGLLGLEVEQLFVFVEMKFESKKN